MKTKFAAALLLLSTLIYQPSTAHAQGTTFTYQGRLNDGANPATGIYDLRFAIHDAITAGSQIAGPLTNSATGVSNGLFTVTLDFGGGVFTGAGRWLEIAVRTNGGGAFTNLAPRQKITATPYAITASNLSGTLPASQLSGALPSGQLSGSYSGAVTMNNSGNSFNGAFTGNGANLTNVNAATLGGLNSSNFWRTTGNAGTTPGVNFLGTTDNQPLELKVNGTRALRLEPTANDANHSNTVNVVNGSPVNYVAPGVYGATIGGGGAGNYFGGTSTNSVTAVFGTVSGGYQNTASGDSATVGGGNYNTAHGIQATVGGGHANTADGIEPTVSGGERNTASGDVATVGGGYFNTASGIYATVGGGFFNLATNLSATVPGGVNNLAGGQYSFAAGRHAKAMHDGSFVWADSTDADFFSTAANQFLIRASGGVGIGTAAPAKALQIGDTTIPNSEGMIRLASRSGTDSSLRAWDIGVPETDGVTAGKSYSFIIDDIFQGNGPEFLIRWDTGNVGIGTTNPTAPLHVSGIAQPVALMETPNTGGTWFGIGNTAPSGQRWSIVSTGTGNGEGAGRLLFFTSQDNSTKMRLEPNGNLFITGTYSPSSDRNVKTNFAAVSARDILDKVTSLPISSWAFKQDAQTKHIGPMAQDFYAAFNLGTDDKHIATVDADGVALAAIQGLNQKLDETRAELKRRDAENAELRQRLEALEKIIRNQTSN